LRVSFFGDELEFIQKVDRLKGKIIENISYCTIFLASYYATTKKRIKKQ